MDNYRQFHNGSRIAEMKKGRVSSRREHIAGGEAFDFGWKWFIQSSLFPLPS
jgi:hypothetical protein